MPPTFYPATDKVDPEKSKQVAQKVCLIAIDGWGISANDSAHGDAIRNAKTPVMSEFAKSSPYSTLAAHGLAVGLPSGLMGNSEVGHLNIGAGRIVYQDIVRIDLAVEKNTLGSLPSVAACFHRAKETNGRIHFLGLLSDGGVHSHQNHLNSLIRAAKAAGIPECYVHCFGDGRDTAPKSISKYLQQLIGVMEQEQYGKIATVVGRYFAMDRDRRWERIELALQCILFGVGEHVTDVVKEVQKRYAADETDEFLKPIILSKEGLIQEGDTLFFFNYRSDRMRQLLGSFAPSHMNFSPLATSLEFPKNLHCTTMTVYKSDYPFPVAFPPQTMDNVLAEWLAVNHIPQCHVAETEKYAHVTFFFNGGCEKQFPGEDRFLIASPKVATYDLKPEMSAIEVGHAVAEAIQSQRYPFVMCNFAPPDMVGHTGKYESALKGVEATDQAIGVISQACQAHGYALMITADHGNAEKMVSENGEPHTAHTTSRVPYCLVHSKRALQPTRPEHALCDVAPTLLDLMGLEIPKEMDGKSLLV